MDCCSGSEERDVSSFHYDFTNLFGEALGRYKEIPQAAEDQAKVFMKLIDRLKCDTPKELVDKVYQMKGKIEKAKALKQNPLDEFGAALKELDPQKKEVQDPTKEDKSEDDGEMDIDED